MTLKTIKENTLPIGVDLGSSTIKMAQLRQSNQGYELIAAGADKNPDQQSSDFTHRIDSLSRCVRNIMRSNEFKSRQCVLSLPAEATFVHHVKIPKMPPKDVPKALLWELQGKLPYAPSKAVVRHLIAGEVFDNGDCKQEVIVIAADRASVDACLTVARRAKLDPIAINVEPCAIVECFARVFKNARQAPRTVLYVDMGSASTQAVLGHGTQIVFARNIPIGSNQLDQAVSDGLSIPIDQATTMRHNLVQNNDIDPKTKDELLLLLSKPLADLTGELTQSLRYYESVFRNRSAESVIFLGGQAYDKRFCQAIAQNLNLPAQVGDPLARIQKAQGAGLTCGLDRNEPQPDWAVAIGLSIGSSQAA